jgi:hypothetical protein
MSGVRRDHKPFALTLSRSACYKQFSDRKGARRRYARDPETEEREAIMTGGRFRRVALALMCTVMAIGRGGLVQAGNPNEREVKPEANVQDGDDITSPDSKVWVLDFKFKGPRLIKVDVPGRGQRVCWYLWYQVTNFTKEPRTFIPDFELVTRDKNILHSDQVLPSVQEAIRRLEDPSNYLKIKNSVTIATEQIPPSTPKAPRPVTGVAIWDDVDPDANFYSIFVSGLSNGWAVTDPIPPSTKPVVRRKTLQLDFKRVGDRYLQKSDDVRFLRSEWIYRGSQIEVPGLQAAPDKQGAPAGK